MSAIAGKDGRLLYGRRTGGSSNLVVYYPMEFGSGTDVFDKSGNGNDGTLSGCTWIYRGKFGKCLGFDGSNDIVDTGLTSPFAVTDDITVSAWVFLHDVSADMSIVSAYDSATTTGWALRYENTGTDGFEAINYEGAGNGLVTKVDAAETVGGWHHVICVIYGNGRQPRLWVDGVEETTTGNAGTVTQLNEAATNIFIGVQSNVAADYFNGLIDEVAIWDRALNEAEVLNVKATRADIQMDDPVHMASIDTWSVSMAADLVETTKFNAGTTKSKEFGYAQKTLTGSCSGTLVLEDDTDTSQEDVIQEIIGSLSKGYLELVLKSGNKIMGRTLESEVSIGAAVAGKATFSMNFTMDSDANFAELS